MTFFSNSHKNYLLNQCNASINVLSIPNKESSFEINSKIYTSPELLLNGAYWTFSGLSLFNDIRLQNELIEQKKSLDIHSSTSTLNLEEILIFSIDTSILSVLSTLQLGLLLHDSTYSTFKPYHFLPISKSLLLSLQETIIKLQVTSIDNSLNHIYSPPIFRDLPLEMESQKFPDMRITFSCLLSLAYIQIYLNFYGYFSNTKTESTCEKLINSFKTECEIFQSFEDNTKETKKCENFYTKYENNKNSENDDYSSHSKDSTIVKFKVNNDKNKNDKENSNNEDSKAFQNSPRKIDENKYNFFSFTQNIIPQTLNKILKDAKGLKEWILKCQNSDGGFGIDINSESHAGITFCALGSLALLGSLNEISSDKHNQLICWLQGRQKQSGGLNGREGKSEDACYSFWVLASLKILNVSLYSTLNVSSLFKFILSCQHPIDGGFSRVPPTSTSENKINSLSSASDKENSSSIYETSFPSSYFVFPPLDLLARGETSANHSNTDIFHTYFSLCGLSLLAYDNSDFCALNKEESKFDNKNLNSYLNSNTENKDQEVILTIRKELVKIHSVLALPQPTLEKFFNII